MIVATVINILAQTTYFIYIFNLPSPISSGSSPLPGLGKLQVLIARLMTVHIGENI